MQKKEQETKIKEKEALENDELFWADQYASQIINRKKYHFIEKEIKKPKEFVVKTSASLSGVLHIGRLSDTIRSSTVFSALKNAGVKAKLIWVAEDMDPMRKIPKGVPKDYEKYLGMPVTDIPDADGCHKSYAEHHKEEYFKVIDEFVFTKMDKFSMREEYKKGNFKPYIKKILEHFNEVKKIQEKYRSNPLPSGWSPWQPICSNCGKIITAKVTGFEDGIIKYKCEDYEFETTTAKGCGYKGENNPLKDAGKMVWKSEWASQWARWNIATEGAGKEYHVPNSAFWINAEIAEKIYDYPMPLPIFYEHLMIDNEKMSASKGNIVYPKDWLEVATPELLILFYNKRLMKTRSFSWGDLPKLYDEFDEYARVYHGEVKLDNKKEEQHIKKLYEYSHGRKIRKPVKMGFTHAVTVSQLFSNKKDMIKSLQKTGHYSKKDEKEIFERLEKSNIWLKKYAPEDMKFELQTETPKDINIDEKQKNALRMIAETLKKKDFDEKQLHQEFYDIASKAGIDAKDLFKASYLVLFKKERGPKLANFILTLGKEKIIELFEKI